MVPTTTTSSSSAYPTLMARKRAFSTAGRPPAAVQNVTIGSRMQNAQTPMIATTTSDWSGECVLSRSAGSPRAMPRRPMTTIASVNRRVVEVRNGTKDSRNMRSP